MGRKKKLRVNAQNTGGKQAEAKSKSEETDKKETKTRTWERPDGRLLLSPYAWAKMLYMRDKGDTEISGFGIADPDNLLKIVDFITVKQTASCATFEMEDDGVSDFALNMVEKGLKPEQFMRVWLHTHPGNFCTPSGTDEECFNRWFGGCDWAVMCILAKDDKMSARLRFNTGPRAEIELPVKVDYDMDFPASDRESWEEEYKANIEKEVYTVTYGGRSGGCSYGTDYKSKYTPGQSSRHHGGYSGWGGYGGYGPYEDPWDDEIRSTGHSSVKSEDQQEIGFKSEKTEEQKEELPEAVWTLRFELNSCRGKEEQKILLQELQIPENKIDDYCVYYGDNTDIVAVPRKVVEETDGIFIYDEQDTKQEAVA